MLMKRLLTIFVVVLVGCGSAVAQVGSATTRGAPARPTTPPTAVPGTIPTIGAAGNLLGAVLLNPGTLGPIPGTSLGAITVCPTTGITISTTTALTPIVTTTPT